MQVRIGDRLGFRSPIGTGPAPELVGVIPCAEVIEAGFGVAFFAGELVVVRIAVGELQFAAPGIIIRLGFDVAGGIGDYRGGLEIVREVIRDIA